MLAMVLEGKSRPGVTGAVDRKSTRLNSSHANISYAVFCLKKKKKKFSKKTTYLYTNTVYITLSLIEHTTSEHICSVSDIWTRTITHCGHHLPSGWLRQTLA